MTDEEFIEQFEACTLPAAQFPHQAHVKLAWLYLNRLSLTEAIVRFSEGVKQFATANGKPERYHETITWAFLLLIHQRLREANDGLSSNPTSNLSAGKSWEDFAAANADILNWEDNILKRYYREETLQSERAKKIFLLPDRLLPYSP